MTKFTEKLPLSLVVIVLNEEKNIERCIKSVPFASDIVILDSGSQDQTLEIAKSLGARTFSEKWRGFGPQKQRATELATQDWVLNLDADEALSPELQQELYESFAGLDPQTGYLMPRKSFHLGRWILHGGWYPDRQLRLYHRQYSHWPDKDIHERVESPREAHLSSPLLHWVFADLQDQVQTNNRYSGLQARAEWARGRSFSLTKLLLKPLGKFVECYFVKLGFLDGMPGFLIAVSAAYSVFLRWGKIWEMEQSEGEPNLGRKKGEVL